MQAFHRPVKSTSACLLSTLITLFLVVVMAAWNSVAFAHASLVSSTPAMGATLSSAPTQAQLVFNEPVSPLVLKLVEPDGTAINLSQIRTLPKGLALSLPPLIQQGSYALSWRVVSADGHPVSGALSFSVGSGDTGANAATADTVSAGRNFLIWLSRLSAYAGLVFGIALAVFHSLGLVRGGRRRAGLCALAFGGVATVLNVGLLGVDALDLPLKGLLAKEAWSIASATSFGVSAIFALAALACAGIAWSSTPVWAKRLWAGLAVFLLGASLAASGHASVAPPEWLARPAVWLHAIAIVLWIGSLWPLAYELNDSESVTLLRGFSRLIPFGLVLLFASGGVLIYLQFDSPASLWLSAYGQILLLKLILLSILLALGAYNRYRLTDAVLRSHTGARRAMKHIIYVELMLALAIFAVVSLWRFTPPPRALSVIPPAVPVISAYIQAPAAIARLNLTLAAHGQPTALTLSLSETGLNPLKAQEVDVSFSNTAAGIAAIVLPARRLSEGEWEVRDIQLPQQDSWQIRIDALISDFERVRLETTLKLTE
ncbi:copper resistance protein CopC/CopD [Paenalcaligenes niemegkensis]|uniref:copper resistance CopC/CopD family protein n=1 Tax=Paenalcaligenes niemegkensis TaxID=2895469 RepID=UPI001EE8347D|nr:copper resistance protein CopC [Paenalcaligenes niemegkensis]MCQ9616052.1 copper resistance protein CopC/CopD [Paenalcaligenes niemegkensis]